MVGDPFTTFEISFASEDDARIGRQRLERAGFIVEADGETTSLVRAGVVDGDGDASAKLDTAIEGLRYDPVMYWQTATLESYP